MNTVHNRIVLISLALTASFLVASCGESKVSQCRKITAVVNKATSAEQAASRNNNPDKVGELEKAAASFDQYAKELEAVKVKDETLQNLQGRIIKMYQATSKASRDLVEAARKQDPRAVDSSLQSLKEATNRESALANEFNQYCH
jgi:CHASE3 domain sensor protein